MTDQKMAAYAAGAARGPRVLVACEFSGWVREAMRAVGCDAVSCDLIPEPWVAVRDRSPHHVVGDVRPLLRERWDLVVAHPPCTYLTQSGQPFADRPGRRERMLDGAAFFLECLHANADRVCVENPVPLAEARAIIGDYAQIVQPYQFGHPWSKRTALWLRGLPPLVPTRVLTVYKTVRHSKESGPSDPFRKYRRSVTFVGVARAMADQWGRRLVEGTLPVPPSPGPGDRVR